MKMPWRMGGNEWKMDKSAKFIPKKLSERSLPSFKISEFEVLGFLNLQVLICGYCSSPLISLSILKKIR